MLRGRTGRRRAWMQPAKDVAKALGTAAGVHPLIPHGSRPQQTCRCQNAPHPALYPSAYTHTHTQTNTYTQTNTSKHSDRPYTDVPVLNMTVSTHIAA